MSRVVGRGSSIAMLRLYALFALASISNDGLLSCGCLGALIPYLSHLECCCCLGETCVRIDQYIFTEIDVRRYTYVRTRESWLWQPVEGRTHAAAAAAAAADTDCCTCSLGIQAGEDMGRPAQDGEDGEEDAEAEQEQLPDLSRIVGGLEDLVRQGAISRERGSFARSKYVVNFPCHSIQLSSTNRILFDCRCYESR
jgi:hypothetical protein